MIESRSAVYPVTGGDEKGLKGESTKEYREALGVTHVLTVSMMLMVSWFHD